MSGINARISKRTIESNIRENYQKYLFIEVDDIYKMHKYIQGYEYYNTFYNSSIKTLSQEINDKNTNITKYLPIDLITFVEEMITMFKNFKIPNGYEDLFDLNKTLKFSIVSKELLEEKKNWKLYLPFTNLRCLIDNRNRFRHFFKDITNVALNREYCIDLIIPDFYNHDRDPGILIAYQIAEVEL